MNQPDLTKKVFNNTDDIDIKQFAVICQQKIDKHDYPLAQQICKQIPIYAGDELLTAIEQGKDGAYMAEIAQVLDIGPGVFVIKNAYQDLTVIEKMNNVFKQLLEQQRNAKAADHFATAGANGRVWNVFEKSAKADPSTFIEYYKNPILQLAAQAWLGPDYQITAQLNVVYPGGGAQHPHRDYHLGFQENDNIAKYPLHVHKMSRYLTLQGGIAHSDMPIASGPTQLLPFSQQYDLGYLAWRNSEFKDYFKAHKVQLSLEQGDALFFNPALFHAAGDNQTKNIERSVNLLQVSSAFSKPMETVNSTQISGLVYPHLSALFQQKFLSSAELNAIISASCDGYSFPSNLDTDPPNSNSMAPQTAAQLTIQALQENWPVDKYQTALNEQQLKRQS
ncbi:MAG: ectoine hydroxylase-related dioxygenase (phytanoyl-CoA dioxygenase family) [Oceanospirillaceae bacterium]|jgi:ectoine hydroxylase-related dioxygenase (phytanoyl-CoA dioxygenase family)